MVICIGSMSDKEVNRLMLLNWTPADGCTIEMFSDGTATAQTRKWKRVQMAQRNKNEKRTIIGNDAETKQHKRLWLMLVKRPQSRSDGREREEN